LVLQPFAGDTKTLCAAACVAKAWHAAATGIPSLWRELRFQGSAADPVGTMARRLTDARLAELAARGAGALQRVDLGGCKGVTLRGVVAALHGATALSSLAVRGVQAGPRDERVYAALRTLGQPAQLDVAARLTVCSATPDEAGARARCGRICGAQDELCAECGIFHCMACRVKAERMRQPPCAHLCDECFRTTTGDEDDFFGCDRCGPDGSMHVAGRNGVCVDCSCMCAACETFLCYDCAFTHGGIRMCKGAGCAPVGRIYCDECVEALDNMTFCDCCQEDFCTACMPPHEVRSCCCGKCFCSECADEALTWASSDDEAEELCAECLHAAALQECRKK
jgi:hypothetical protein